jgi:hypothetical protein
MKRYIALIALVLAVPQLSEALKIYGPFYDSYQGAEVSEAPIPQGKYRTGWKAGRYRAHWHDKNQERWRQGR